MSRVMTFCLGISRGLHGVTASWEQDGDVLHVTRSAPGLAQRNLAALHLSVL